MNFDWMNFLDLDYYLATELSGDFLWGYLIFVYFVFVFMSGGMAMSWAGDDKYAKKSVKKGFLKFKFLGATGIVLVISRFGNIDVLSMRIWLFLAIFISFVLLVWRIFSAYRMYKLRTASVKRETALR